MNLDQLSEVLIEKQLISAPLTEEQPIGGGCINKCFKIGNLQSTYFIKTNDASKFPSMFQKEADGLKALRNSKTLRIPQTIDYFEMDNQSFLLLEYLQKGVKTTDFWWRFGQELAQLHLQTNSEFGFHQDNFIGSLVQKNSYKTNWAEFFLACRLIPQIEIGVNQGWASAKHFKEAENLAKVVEDEFPVEPASLLHGDLWSGNYLIGPNGEPCIVDPAVYYGNREMEIAFTKMFGGFRPEFYESYQTAYPLQEDFDKRLDINQLYPLLVHANLFGGHYAEETKEFLQKFSSKKA